MPRRPAVSALPLLALLVGAAAEEDSAYFADWGVIGGRPQEPTCVDIPENMPLCSGIDYNKMRLPNLLEHDTLKEAQQQAGYWVPLLNLRCHPNTQLFLCSLFTPVCLESPIPPCRSLCEAVRQGCESRMQTYSFPWPDMLNCDKFPLDNDMCITVQHTGAPGPGECYAAPRGVPWPRLPRVQLGPGPGTLPGGAGLGQGGARHPYPLPFPPSPRLPAPCPHTLGAGKQVRPGVDTNNYCARPGCDGDACCCR